ncbi:hypothetical protein AURANDRAFT_63814 [Aureococcus anophagefferens]|uniref:PX domain-containing protein n=1 Tax=Aureococcus anophagefferens TaxID=44056 RepID=F0Y7W5_AURAN|nr:hypothetical protein AURANDRAFT_63814 [Aureococcus anophagefferens]EGB08820.1 hypothetical protein AURANDRAFT_63814 [Aureococcus anophagefferens]|eukprot:XP_009036798.1 hypothetical protein AURANDRAFT_63814 [Aureococcus anophagefferens]
MVAAKAGGLRSPPRARSPLRTMSDVEVSSLKRPTSCWFEEEGPSKPDPDDLLAAGAMDLVALIARDVTARLPVCTYDRGAGAYAICTAVATRRVQARVSRSLKDFARLRRELLAVLPELSSVINVSDLSNLGGSLGRGEALLPSLPARTLKRRSTQRAVGRDVRTLSGDGTATWYASKERALTTWIRDTLKVFANCLALAGSSSDAARLEAKSRAEALLIGFLLKSAKVAVRRASELAPTPAETRSARAGTV